MADREFKILHAGDKRQRIKIEKNHQGIRRRPDKELAGGPLNSIQGMLISSSVTMIDRRRQSKRDGLRGGLGKNFSTPRPDPLLDQGGEGAAFVVHDSTVNCQHSTNT
jgi:hypothetical protein